MPLCPKKLTSSTYTQQLTRTLAYTQTHKRTLAYIQTHKRTLAYIQTHKRTLASVFRTYILPHPLSHTPCSCMRRRKPIMVGEGGVPGASMWV